MADRLYLDHVGKNTFCGLLASLRGQLFRDSDFAKFSCADNGRRQSAAQPAGDGPAVADSRQGERRRGQGQGRLRHPVESGPGIEIEDRPFAKSTLQVFRAQLILHDKVREVFESSLRLARESGYLKKRGMRLALDTTNILGQGAVKDTFNLLADGIVKLMRALASVEQTSVERWAKARGYERYLGSSIKGESAIDWSDRKARAALLGEIVADADRLLEVARQAQGELPEGSPEWQGIVAAAELLLQDVERDGDGIGLKDGVAKDRMVSVHDPEMRHRPQEQQPAVRRAQGGHCGGHRLRVDRGRGGIARQRSGQPRGPGTGGTEQGHYRYADGGVAGRCRLWRRRHQAGLRRRGTQSDCPSAGTPEQSPLSQGWLPD